MRDSKVSGIIRITAGVMGLMMLVIGLFSAFYIASETDHACCGEDCPVCACLRQCENILHGLGEGIAARSAAAPVRLIFLAAAFVTTAVFQDTLISRKVRLNN